VIRPARVRDRGMHGIGAFVSSPPLAWSGWRLGIPGGPDGGQYHGFIGPDSRGFRTANLQEIGPEAPHGEEGPPAPPSSGPWASPWWGGTGLSEGENVSDFVYRSSAELRPRPNASGGANTVRAFQEERTAGFAVAPGNYKALGAVVASPLAPRPTSIVKNYNPLPSGQICPAWGCGPVPFRSFQAVQHGIPMGPGATNKVPQPPPPTYPVVGPTVSGHCPAGQYQDAAGNCTSDWHNPYSLYLPDQSGSPAPAPTVAASTCPTGYTQDPTTGNCYAPGTAPGTGITAWLAGSTTIGGVNIPNALLAGVGGLLVFKMMRK
jgi:hypothetical protein